MRFFTQHYEQLSDNDVENEATKTNWNNPRRGWMPFTIVSLILFASITTIGGASYSTSTVRCHHNNSDTITKDCGNSTAEAQRRGCSFDMLNFAWQVPECYDEELINDFLSQEEWKFFHDAEGQYEVPIKVVAMGETDMLYAQWEFHVVHCKYTWTQMHRVLEFGRPIDSHLSRFEHTKHCGEVLMEDGHVEGGKMMTQTPIIYPTCTLGQLWQQGS